MLLLNNTFGKMTDAENNSFGAIVKKEIEEDWSNSEMIHENISIDYIKEEFKQEVDCYIEEDGGISIHSIKQECKQEVDWDCIKDECPLDYAENLELVPNLEINFDIIQDKQKLFQCPECPVKAKYKANLNRHISFMHSKNKPVGITPKRIASHFLQIACKKNNLLFKNKVLENHEFVRNESMNNTELLKKKKYKYCCSNCSFNCKYKCDLIYHVYKLHFYNNDSQNKYSVRPHCNKILHQHENQKAHMVYCTSRKIFQCEHCSYSDKNKSQLKQHIFAKHFIDGVFQNESPKQYILPACPRCGKRYAYSSTLSNHIAFCGKTLPFQCKTCSYASDHKKTFMSHILTHLKKSNLCQDLRYR